MSTPLYVGIDVAMNHLDVAIATSAKSQQSLGRFENEGKGWRRLARQLKAQVKAAQAEVVHVVLEASGGYEAAFVAFVHQQAWRVSSVNPWQVRSFIDGQGVRAKTDRIDALMLAHFAATHQPEAQEPLDDGAAELAELLARRQDLEKLQQAERNRLALIKRKPRTPRAVRQSVERTLQALAEELQAIEAAIQEVLTKRSDLEEQRDLLQGIPAIGNKLSLEMLVLCHHFWAHTAGKGSGKQLVAFLGLDPKPQESGKSKKHAAISHQGNPRLRALLYCGALGGVSGKNPLRAWYQKLLAQGKPKKVALVACSRKVLTWVWALFTSNLPFDPARFPVALPSPS
jgi:transposase